MQRALILVVDDDAQIAEIASEKLKGAGFEVERADSADMAKAKTGSKKPDLILMDINMPEVNGTEAFLDFKKNPELKDIPIAFFTNLAEPWPGVSGNIKQFAKKELGAAEFFDKSADLENLGEKVTTLLQKIK